MNQTQQHKKPDKYKPHFCDVHFYVKHQKNFSDFETHLTVFPRPIQFALWCLFLCMLRRPNDWFNGYRTSHNSNKSDACTVIIKPFFQNFPTLAWPNKLTNDTRLTDFVSMVRIKAIPNCIFESIQQILSGNYPILFLDHEPTATELLKIQCFGQRVITFNSNYQNWPHLKYGERDVLSFWLHDLVHAEHFFSQPELMTMQIGFYRYVNNSLKTGLFQKAFQDSESFKSAFDYLISDMNSHPLHLLKTYRAIVDIHFGQKWDLVLKTNPFCDEVTKQSLEKLNQNNFTNNDCDVVLHYLKGLGAQSHYES